MNTDEIIQSEAKYIVQTYIRPGIVFSHGQGLELVDLEGNRYLDFTSGIAVTALGHADAEWTQVVAQQAGQLVHVSNLYHTAAHVELAKMLVENSFADRVFFCNSGAEANEAALKFARKFAGGHNQKGEIGYRELDVKRKKGPLKNGIVAFSGGFHGRTMGALAATHKEKYRRPFAPLVPGITFANFNDLASAQTAVNETTCAVIVEPIQGEGGVHPATPEFLQGLRSMCDEAGALLIFDEVQCGLGRSGRLWAHEQYGVTPDIMTLAKPLAGGLPIGAALVTEAVAQTIEPGDHGSTFAAGPLVCRAAQVVFERVNRPAFLAQVQENGRYLHQKLNHLPADKVVEIRGAGLLIGLELTGPAAPVIIAARDRGLIIIGAGENIVRLCPALTVNKSEIDQAVAILAEALKTI